MAEKPFIRVRDKATGHQYDIHKQAFNPEKHEALTSKRFPPVASPRRPKHSVRPPKRVEKPEETGEQSSE